MTKTTQDSAVRSSKEIKARLLRDAWMTGAAADIISRIQFHHQRSVALPEGHGEALSHIVPGQDPALMRVNLRNYLAGYPCAFSSADSAEQTAPLATLPEPKRYEAHEIFEQMLAEEKGKAEKPDFLLVHGPLLLAESLDDLAFTGRPFYADDVSLAKHAARTRGELDHTGHTNVHDPYMDTIYQARIRTANLSEIFDKVGGTILEETYYADDVYLAGNPEKATGELDYTPHPDVQKAYEDDVYEAKCSGEALYEFMESIAESKQIAASTMFVAPTTLVHEKVAEAHSPYIDAFFNAARWSATTQGITIDDETRKEAEAMDSKASTKLNFILQ